MPRCDGTVCYFALAGFQGVRSVLERATEPLARVLNSVLKKGIYYYCVKIPGLFTDHDPVREGSDHEGSNTSRIQPGRARGFWKSHVSDRVGVRKFSNLTDRSWVTLIRSDPWEVIQPAGSDPTRGK